MMKGKKSSLRGKKRCSLRSKWERIGKGQGGKESDPSREEMSLGV